MNELKSNPVRIFDYFQKIQFPIYLFHSTILMKLANVYNEDFYGSLCMLLKIPESKRSVVIGCLYTLMAFIVSIIWATVVYMITASRKTVQNERSKISC